MPAYIERAIAGADDVIGADPAFHLTTAAVPQRQFGVRLADVEDDDAPLRTASPNRD
jgi:hypothetical protein